jgi:hypothetical protein
MLNRVLLKINFDPDTTWSPSFIVGEIVEQRHFMTEEFPILIFTKFALQWNILLEFTFVVTWKNSAVLTKITFYKSLVHSKNSSKSVAPNWILLMYHDR